MIRRLVDITISSLVLLILLPVFLLVALAILLDSPGNPLYRGWRAGKDGRLFRMLKFRSMVVNADRSGSAVTGKTDPRITRVGYFIRKTKLDEFPQFWNVLIGDMTLIGPRPEAPSIVKLYTSEQRQVLRVKPGLTGPSQISCTEDESMAVLSSEAAERYYIQHVLERRLAIDAAYLQSRSLSGDLALVGQTIGLMLRALFGNGSRAPVSR
jgi:lipopolysaccharide/colanic/teichoic acid biosynthesis glycosyltransferase